MRIKSIYDKFKNSKFKPPFLKIKILNYKILQVKNTKVKLIHKLILRYIRNYDIDFHVN